MSNSKGGGDWTRRSVVATIAGASAGILGSGAPAVAALDGRPKTARVEFPDGGYAYLPGGAFPFSNGVAALPGYTFTRVRLRGLPSLADGLAIAADFLKARGLPPTAMAVCELRSPAPLPRSGFVSTNDNYTRLLRLHGFGSATGYPMGRSNVAPQFNPPATQSLYAFTFVSPASAASGSEGCDFIISGKAELSENPPMIVAEGDTSPTGLQAKAAYVIEDLRARLLALTGRWQDITGVQVYTEHPLESVMGLLRANDLTGVGMTLHPSYPPVLGLEFEVDVRSVPVELVV